MATRGAKRKAVLFLDRAAKKMRAGSAPVIDISTSNDDGNHKNHSDEEHDDEEEEPQSESSISEDGRPSSTESPLTPFSPSPNPERKVFNCRFEGCTKRFSRSARMHAHLRSHFEAEKRLFSCVYEGCNKSYCRRDHLSAHVRSAHTKEKVYQCDFPDCEKSFGTNQRLKKHQDIHRAHDRYRCTAYPPCNQHFRKHQTLQRHILSEHLSLVPFPCRHVDSITGIKCAAGFDGSVGLRKHEERAHGPKRFWCDECSVELHDDRTSKQVGFTTKSELSRHISNEHAQCIFCDLKLSSQRDLEKHLELRHNEAGQSLTQRQRNPSALDLQSVACIYPDCYKTFSKRANLTAHVRTAHQKQLYTCSQDAPNVPYKDLQVVLWSGFNACGRDFTSKANLEDHIRTQHLGLPTIINAKRGKVLDPAKAVIHKAPDAVDVLIGAVYEEREISCWVNDCSRLFVRQFDLERHLRTKHGLTLNGTSLEHDNIASGQGYDGAELEWEIKQDAEDGGQLRIGGEELMAGDEWMTEQMEMRGLIDPDLFGL